MEGDAAVRPPFAVENPDNWPEDEVPFAPVERFCVLCANKKPVPDTEMSITTAKHEKTNLLTGLNLKPPAIHGNTAVTAIWMRLYIYLTCDCDDSFGSILLSGRLLS
jgi:hypothetical protein